MKPEDVIVRFRQPTGNDPVGNLWQNSGEARWFKSFKAAWSYIRDCEGYHPLTGDLLNGQELVETVHRSKIEDSGIYFLDVFGKDEKNARKAFHAGLRRGRLIFAPPQGEPAPR